MSMPPPSPKTTYPHSSGSSRSSLVETTRTNIRQSTWDDIQTPHERYTQTVAVRHEVDVQFDELLVRARVDPTNNRKPCRYPILYG